MGLLLELSGDVDDASKRSPVPRVSPGTRWVDPDTEDHQFQAVVGWLNSGIALTCNSRLHRLVRRIEDTGCRRRQSHTLGLRRIPSHS